MRRTSTSIIKMNFLCSLGEMLRSFICCVIIMQQFDYTYLSHLILFLLTTVLANEFFSKKSKQCLT